MSKWIGAVVGILLVASSVTASEKEASSESLVKWMRAINTLELDFHTANKKYANSDELMTFAKTAKRGAVVVSELNPAALAPYTLQVAAGGDGAHYQAAIKRPSDMKDKATWCKSAVFSDESGVIYLGTNIGCVREKENQ